MPLQSMNDTCQTELPLKIMNTVNLSLPQHKHHAKLMQNFTAYFPTERVNICLVLLHFSTTEWQTSDDVQHKTDTMV